jgi:hypothetical protein
LRNDDPGLSGKEALTLVVLGAAAGALATYLVNTIKSEQPAGLSAGPEIESARDWIKRAATRLQESRDRIVDAVEKTRPS